MHLLDQDILLYPGFTAGRAGGANLAAGRGTTPGPGRGAGPGCVEQVERLLDLDLEQVTALVKT